MHCTSLSPYDLSKVVRLLLAVAGASTLPPEPHERQRAIGIASCWAPEQSAASLAAIVDTAYVAARSGIDVEQVAFEIAGVLNHQEKLQLLADLGQIAQADGHLEVREAVVIAKVRAVLHRAEEEPVRSRARCASPESAPRQQGIQSRSVNGLGLSA